MSDTTKTVDAYCIEGAAAELDTTRSGIYVRIANGNLATVTTLDGRTRLISGASVRKLKKQG